MGGASVCVWDDGGDGGEEHWVHVFIAPTPMACRSKSNKSGKAKKKKSKKALSTEAVTTHSTTTTPSHGPSSEAPTPPWPGATTPQQVYTRLTSLADFRVRPGNATTQESDVSDGDVLSDEEEEHPVPLDPGTVKATLNRMLVAAGLGDVLEVVFRRPPGALHLSGGIR